MKKEVFYHHSNNRPFIDVPSFYKLEITTYRNDIKGYHKSRGENYWSFPVSTDYNFYSSKEKAEEIYRQYIKNIGEFYKPHSALIKRIALDRPWDDSSRLAWWLYDSEGNEIDHSICVTQCQRLEDIQDYYFGRRDNEIRFKPGDIVEILGHDSISLGVLNDVPATIEEVWARHRELCEKEEPELLNSARISLLPSGERDEYYYITPSWFDFDAAPYMIFKPTFSMPVKIKTIFEGLYQSWKENIDSLINGEIEWEELQEKVIGKKVHR